MVDFDFLKYVILDNFEMLGICASAPGQPAHTNDFVSFGAAQGPLSFENLYMHGISHLQYASGNGSPGCTGAVCFNAFAFDGNVNNGTIGENIIFNVIDDSDSDPQGLGFILGGGYNIAYNVVRYTSQGLGSTLHTFHDNLYEYFFENGHSNMYEANPDGPSAINTVYNNVFRHLQTSGAHGGVGVLLSPCSGTTDYMFNNVFYDEGPMELIGLSQTQFCNPKGQITFFNNTLEFGIGTGNSVSCFTPSGTFTLTNNFYVSDSAPYASLTYSCSSYAASTELTLTHAAANANTSPKFNQYTNWQTYANSPMATTNSTVGAGTSEITSHCSAMRGSSDVLIQAAGAACNNDTTFGVTYSATSHTVSWPARTVVARPVNTAWDRGAYQFSSTQANAPTPPTGLAAMVQ
jgi:hypothetical protein